ncbi:hypothetical protein B0H11DRAFT_1919807 [Mycena galericulata]|nr:hypothetical protein B0H11DRAFT_1919807 [Mycena galericulata]
MCYFVPTSIFCPCCETGKSRMISVIRCAVPIAGQCQPWDRYYSNNSLPSTRRSIDSIDPLSSAPFRDLSFIVRPCTSCTRKIVRGARLIAFEQDIRHRHTDEADLRHIFPTSRYLGGDHLTKAVRGYRADDYPVDLEFGDKTGAIYMPAVRCSKLVLPVAYADGSAVVHSGSSVEVEVRNLEERGFLVERYDALQYFEWSWELSTGSIFGGDFTRIDPLPPSCDRVHARMYDEATELWDHPFVGDWADIAVAVQEAPFQGKELSSVLRSYMINGLRCQPSMSFLAPDCFAHTLFSVEMVVSLVRAHSEQQQHRRGELGMAISDSLDGLMVEAPVPFHDISGLPDEKRSWSLYKESDAVIDAVHRQCYDLALLFAPSSCLAGIVRGSVLPQYNSAVRVLYSCLFESISPPRVTPGVRSDGSWGPHEYTILPQLFCADSPYMAWIPASREGSAVTDDLSSSVCNFQMSTVHFRPDRAWPSRGTMEPTVLEAFQEEVNSVYCGVTKAMEFIKSNDVSPEIRLPLCAVERAYASILALRVNFLTRRDLLEYVACLKRSVAELRGFISWVHDLDYWLGNSVTPIKVTREVRGAVCEDLETYRLLHRLGIPAWCFVAGMPSGSCAMELPLARDSFRYETLSGFHLHNKAIFFYPPVVNDTRMFELAARGYAPREDRLHRDKGYRKDLGAMEAVYDKINEERHAAEQRSGVRTPSTDVGTISRATIARVAGMTIYNLNFSALLQNIDLNPASAPSRHAIVGVSAAKMWEESRTDIPSWVLPYNDTWDRVAQPLPESGREALRPSDRVHMMHVLPLPSYFFHVKSPEKLKSYFYIWTTIRRCIVARHAQTGFASFDVALTAQLWRDVLSGVYFKLRNHWQGEQFNPSVDKAFDVATFWEFGGPLVFGADDDPSEDKTPVCMDGTQLRPSDFDSPRLRALMLWDLSVLHCQVQLDRADVLLYDGSGCDPQDVSVRTQLRCSLFRPEGCALSLSNCPWDSTNPSDRKPWFERFQLILCGWPYFEGAVNQTAFLDLHGRLLWKRPGAVDIASLSDRDYEALEGTMVYVYYRGIADKLGIMPVVPFKKPTYVGDMKKFMSI